MSDADYFKIERPARRSGNLVLASFCAIGLIAYVQRTCISVTSTPIEVQLSLNKDQLGTLLSIFYWGYALLQIPAGWVTDRWGTRRTLSVTALGWSLATAMLSQADTLRSMQITWFMIGGLQAAIFACATKGMRDWLPATAWARGNGALGASIYLGGALATSLTGVLLLWIDWRWVYFLYAIPGVLWAVLFWTWFRDRPTSQQRVENGLLTPAPLQAVDLDADGPSSLGRLLRSVTLWALMAQQFFRCAAYIFFGTWFPKFLQEQRGFDLSKSGLMSSLPWLATCAGCLLAGTVADRILCTTGSRRISRQGVSLVGLLACAILAAVSTRVANANLAVFIISAGSFCAAFAGIGAFTVSMDIGGRDTGKVFSMMNATGNIGSAAFPIVIGAIMTRTGDWNIVVLTFAALYVVAAVCWLFIDPVDRGIPIVSDESKITVPVISIAAERGSLNSERIACGQPG